MRKLFLMATLAAVGVLAAPDIASAQQLPNPMPRHRGPHATSVTWPSVSPSGWYTNTYNHAWYYPWYAYYNYSHGPYANWQAGNGVATYTYHGPAGHYNYTKAASSSIGEATSVDGAPIEGSEGVEGIAEPSEQPELSEGIVSVTLPADAKLLFNGVAASGSGGVRKFRTTALQPGQSYRYELTAEVVRDGRTERVTESVVVRAGATAAITLTPTGVKTAGAK